MHALTMWNRHFLDEVVQTLFGAEINERKKSGGPRGYGE